MPSGRAKNLQRYCRTCHLSTFLSQILFQGPLNRPASPLTAVIFVISRWLNRCSISMPTYPLSIFLGVIANLYPDQSPAPQSLQRISKGSRKPEILATFRHHHHHWRIISQFLRNSSSNCNSCTLPGFFWQSSQTGGQPRQEMRWHPGKKRQDLNPFTFLVKYSLYKCEKLSRQCHRLPNWNWDELACQKSKCLSAS